MLLLARSAKTERKTKNKTERLCPPQRSVLADVLELRRQNGAHNGPSRVGADTSHQRTETDQVSETSSLKHRTMDRVQKSGIPKVCIKFGVGMFFRWVLSNFINRVVRGFHPLQMPVVSSGPKRLRTTGFLTEHSILPIFHCSLSYISFVSLIYNRYRMYHRAADNSKLVNVIYFILRNMCHLHLRYFLRTVLYTVLLREVFISNISLNQLV
jgi:hypothetical protein